MIYTQANHRNTRNIAPYVLRMVKSYLSDRKLLVDEDYTLNITCGVPQGSVLGPILWNIYYDDVLRLEMPKNVKLVAYADDLAVIVSGKTKHQLVAETNIAIQRIADWMYVRKLELAPEKTEAVLLNDKKEVRRLTLDVLSTEVDTKPEIKYLGVTFDTGATMRKHIENACKRAEASALSLCRLMPNQAGPTESRRKLLSAVAHSILLYAAPVWHNTLQNTKSRKMCQKVQRKLAIRICSSFRTVSTQALLVISRTIPIEIQADERHRTKGKGANEKVEERRATLDSWQEIWEQEREKGQWTKKLIPDVRPWFNRRHGEVNYFLSQMLSGHGCFQAYFHRFKLSDTPKCCYCENVDNAEHTFFQCPRWNMERLNAEQQIGDTITPNNIVEHMMESIDKWNIVRDTVQKILRTKEEDRKRLRQIEAGINIVH